MIGGCMKIDISSDRDIIQARAETRELLKQLAFPNTVSAFVITAVSELTRNIISYAGRGVLHIEALQGRGKKGVEIVAEDQGPGIMNIEDALQDGFSSINSLGLGLPGVKRLMDEFEISSEVQKGTRVRAVKWHNIT